MTRLKKALLYILIAYLFALGVRFLLYYLASQHPDFIYDDRIIAIWTADGGLHGHYAKELLAGHHLDFGPDTALGYLIYWITKSGSLSLDTVIFVLPAFLASLIVVPIVLIGFELGLLELGFLSALAASIGMNYYFRTHLGYTDTDILNYVLFYAILYSYIALAKRGSILFGLVALLLNLLFLQWYHSAKPLVFGIWLFFVLYLLLFDRKNVGALLGAIVAFLAFLPLNPWVIVGLGGVVTAIFWYGSRRFGIDYRWILALFVLGALGGGWYGYSHGFYKRAVEYLNKKEAYVLKDKAQRSVELEATLKTVAEARGITFDDLALYSAGGMSLFILGSLGFLLLMIRYKEARILLVAYLITLVSLRAGVRFSTFGVPVIVFGFFYLFYEIYQKLSHKPFAKLVLYLPAMGLIGYYLYVIDGYNHLLKPFFLRGEVAALKGDLNDEKRGYILTWWDYGWPLWYYTNKRTIIDNGKHHYDNYIIAKSLFESDHSFVANFDRFFVEQYDRIYPWAVLPYVIKKEPIDRLLARLKESSLGVKKRNK
ncbi:MAG: hypothetical protein C6H99_01810, partial [Epsilonproteobacteria bacterium]|nr:hypothetical protein [Campylobacterota bacterium]NPA65030.1 hypothetical protein [Campylobacterota bacterium]